MLLCLREIINPRKQKVTKENDYFFGIYHIENFLDNKVVDNILFLRIIFVEYFGDFFNI